MAAHLFLLFVLNSCGLQSAFIHHSPGADPPATISDDEIAQSVFLIGDAGEPAETPQEPTLALLEREASRHSERNTIVFLGDNVYADGIPEQDDPHRLVAESRLKQQRDIVERSGSFGIFIAGNHDWGEGEKAGAQYLEREEELLESHQHGRIEMSPEGASPGPGLFDIGERIRLITLDTEWWLNEHATYRYPNAPEKSQTEQAVIDSLVVLMRGAAGRYILVAGHHPMLSHGEHAGYFDWRDHIFPSRRIASWLWIPTPIIGSLYPVLRHQWPSPQDESSTVYKSFVQHLDSAFTLVQPLLYASGHEHVLEVLKTHGQYTLLVSGFGTAEHNPSLTHDDNTLFAHAHPGFMRIDILRDNRVRLSVIEPDDAEGITSEVYSRWLAGAKN